jgi:hypothetical protein
LVQRLPNEQKLRKSAGEWFPFDYEVEDETDVSEA